MIIDLQEINNRFHELISQRGVHNRLNETSSAIRTLRLRFKKGGHISVGRKLELLHKEETLNKNKMYSQSQLTSLTRFILRNCGNQTEFDVSELIAKWERPLLKSKQQK